MERKLPASEPFPGIGFQITTEVSQLTIYHATNRTELSNTEALSPGFGEIQAMFGDPGESAVLPD